MTDATQESLIEEINDLLDGAERWFVANGQPHGIDARVLLQEGKTGEHLSFQKSGGAWGLFIVNVLGMHEERENVAPLLKTSKLTRVLACHALKRLEASYKSKVSAHLQDLVVAREEVIRFLGDRR